MFKIDNTTGMWIFRFIALFCIIFLDICHKTFMVIALLLFISIVWDASVLGIKYLDGALKWQQKDKE
jgi:hypothetical protein